MRLARFISEATDYGSARSDYKVYPNANILSSVLTKKRCDSSSFKVCPKMPMPNK